MLSFVIFPFLKGIYMTALDIDRNYVAITMLYLRKRLDVFIEALTYHSVLYNYFAN